MKKILPMWLVVNSMLCSCSISMQNISTHGTATDLVDEMQTTTPDITADLDIPVKPL
jgi:hypothetical protein